VIILKRDVFLIVIHIVKLIATKLFIIITLSIIMIIITKVIQASKLFSDLSSVSIQCQLQNHKRKNVKVNAVMVDAILLQLKISVHHIMLLITPEEPSSMPLKLSKIELKLEKPKEKPKQESQELMPNSIKRRKRMIKDKT